MAVYYLDDADCTLHNLAKSSSWSGHVVTNEHGVLLDDDAGLWPSIMLRRWGNDILYGTTIDPLVETAVEIKFEREPRRIAP